MMTVMVLQRFAQEGGAAYNTGERIGLPDALARSLIDRGVVVRAYDTPPVHRMIDTAPIKKDTRKGRDHAK